MKAIRRWSCLAVVFCALIGSGCWPEGPTENDIESGLQPLQSVAGSWTGSASSEFTSVVAFQFTLAQNNGDVTGSGTMQEQAQAKVPIKITGIYRNQGLVLVFTDMVHEGVAVQGAFQSVQAPVVGTSGLLRLTGTSTNYDKTLSMTLVKQ